MEDICNVVVVGIIVTVIGGLFWVTAVQENAAKGWCGTPFRVERCR